MGKKKPLKQKTLLGYFGSSSSPPPMPPSEPSTSKAGTSPARPKFKGKRPAPPKRVPASDEDSDSDSGSTSSNVGGIAFEPDVIEVSTSDEEVASPKRPPATQRRTQKRRADSVEDTSAAMATESDDDVISAPVTWKGKAKAAESKGKRKRTVLDSDSDENPPPRKSKLVKGVRPPTPDTEEEDLVNEVEKERILESRLRTRDKKSKYQISLEKLKRKKRGEAVESESSASESEEEDNGIIPGARPTNELFSDEEDEEDLEDEGLSGFIEEDSNQVIELPAEFSMNTYQDLMHHFKIICQLFVHLAVQPVEKRREFMQRSMKDQYFSVPLQIARRKITGMRDSLVTSSVWPTAFKKPLEKFPEFETVIMDFTVPGCDACRLGARISTVQGRCFGDTYDRTTFESLSDSDSSDDSDEEETKKEFHLGRFCARRTRVFHKFTHWEYALFSALNQEVQDLQSRSSKQRVYVPVAYAGGAQPPDDLTDADGIMNWLDERGMIANEWQRIKDMMESARNLEVASKRGDDDD